MAICISTEWITTECKRT